MYDMFFISDEYTDSSYFLTLKEIYPHARSVSSIEEACEKSRTQLLWLVWKDSLLNFNFNFVPEQENSSRVHVWVNQDNLTEIALFPKNRKISKRENEFRYFVNSVKFTITNNPFNNYDIAFISYNETYAYKRFQDLLSHPGARSNRIFHIRGVSGIQNAHKEAAKKALTNMFWVIDADAEVLPDFKFDLRLSPNEEKMVHLWYSRNPINGLEYGYGGIKLFPKQAALEMDTHTVDMTTSLTKDIKVIPTVGSISHFNTDPFSTWRSSFRECAKLSSRVINKQDDSETIERLNTWRFNTSDKPFAEYSRGGASAGEWFGSTYKDNKEMLSKINDYKWLEGEFYQHIKMFPPETFK